MAYLNVYRDFGLDAKIWQQAMRVLWALHRGYQDCHMSWVGARLLIATVQRTWRERERERNRSITVQSIPDYKFETFKDNWQVYITNNAVLICPLFFFICQVYDWILWHTLQVLLGTATYLKASSMDNILASSKSILRAVSSTTDPCPSDGCMPMIFTSLFRIWHLGRSEVMRDTDCRLAPGREDICCWDVDRPGACVGCGRNSRIVTSPSCNVL